MDRKTVLPAALFSALAAASVAAGDVGLLPFVVWLVALVLAAWRLWPTSSGGRRIGWSWGTVIVLTSVASAFRVYRILDEPNGLATDELATALNLDALSSKPLAPFGSTPLIPLAAFAHWGKTSNLYLYFARLLSALAGGGLVGIKALSVAPGIAAVPALYFLGRRALSPAGAALSAGLLAVSAWHVTLSRWGWDEVLVTTPAIAVFAALLAADETGSRLAYWGAGVAAGLSLHAYIAAWIGVAAAFAFLMARRVLAGDNRRLRGLRWFTFGLLQAAAPLWAMVEELDAGRLDRAILLLPRERLPSLPKDLRLLPAVPLRNRFGDTLAIAVGADAMAIEAVQGAWSRTQRKPTAIEDSAGSSRNR